MGSDERGSVEFNIATDTEQLDSFTKVLHVIDATPILYKCQEINFDTFSMHPVQLFIKTIVNMLSDVPGDIVVCMDTPATIKKQLYDTDSIYKADRSDKTEIFKKHRRCFDLGIRYVCKELGITYQKINGYEADDMIYNTVVNEWDNYDAIIIHSQDSDMYFMIDGKVIVNRGRGPNGMNLGVVTMGTFESIGKGKVETPYNVAPYYTMYYKNKDNRGRIYIDRYREILNIVRGINGFYFTRVNIVKDISKEFLNDDEMNILNLALPLELMDEDKDGLNKVASSLNINKLNLFNLNMSDDLSNIYNELRENYNMV